MPKENPYEEWSVQLKRYVISRLGDRDLAEDIAQEALSRLWLRLVEGDPLHNPKSWLFRIAHNLAVDVVRRRLPAAIGIEALGGVPDPASVVPEEEWFRTRGGDVPRAELLRRVPAALDGLAGPYREVLVGHYRDGLTCQQLAARERISLDNVKVRLHRARKHLQAVLERQCHEASGL